MVRIHLIAIFVVIENLKNHYTNQPNLNINIGNMIYISLPTTEIRRLSFYLAMEEYAARNINLHEDCFFMWQVEPSVIFGRNQLIENEVNIDYCKRMGIHTYRRKSGGGCVYADMNNIMFSYITRSENVALTFDTYINMVTEMLRKLNVPATTSGRNDILIDGRKVSGNAFYHIPHHSIVHGTMLYDTNMENMVATLTPSDEKLVSKGVKSVRQRIAMLKDYIDLDIDEFKLYTKQALCTSETTLDENDIKAIEKIEEEYLCNDFIIGSNPRYTKTTKMRIEGVGELEARMEIKAGIIKQVNILGDYFLLGDLNKEIISPLIGQCYDKESISCALPEHTENTIRNLNKQQLTDLLYGKQENLPI